MCYKIEVENTDVNIVRNLIPMRNLMPSERLWSESHFRLVTLRSTLTLIYVRNFKGNHS